jgi:hypothetical protein
MASFIRRLKFAWEYFVKKRHRLTQLTEPPDFDYPVPDERLMRFLTGMYEDHGALATWVNHWVRVDGGRLHTRAVWFNLKEGTEDVILQVDFITLTADGRHIVESFAGVGSDVPSALIDAAVAYQDCTFHVLLTTLLKHPCEHVEYEDRTIGGQRRRLTLGSMRMHLGRPLQEIEDWWKPALDEFWPHLDAISLSPGLHWMRFFYFYAPSMDPTVEVLLDNETHETLEARAAELPWPQTEHFYSVRIFFTVEDGPAGAGNEA